MHGHWLNDLFYNFDDSIFKATYNLEQNIPWLANFAKFISWFGNSPAPLLLLLAVVLCVFRKTRKKGIVVTLAILFEVLLVNLVLKNVISRPRLFWNESNPYYHMWVYAQGTYHTSYSFPSGHTAIATAIGVGLFLTCNKKYSWSFLLFPLLMGWSRIAIFVHYPSDVLVSLIIVSLTTVGAYYLSYKVLFKIKFVENLIYGEKLF